MMRFLLRLLRDRRGMALTELAAAAPVLMLLVLAGTEIARYSLLNQKLDRVASSMGDLVAQADTLTAAQLDQLFAASTPVAWPFDFPVSGRVIVSAVVDNGGTPRVNWQRGGGGAFAAASRVGTAGRTATLPAGMTVRAGDTLIVAEVFFGFSPVLYPAVAPAATLYHAAFFRPRLGSLAQLG
jgi:Flp pilus assembly protein TadG